MDKEVLTRYARLLARRGLAVKPGEEVWITAAFDQPEFVRMVVEECYLAGAAKVVVDWEDDGVSRLHAIYRSLETLSTVDDVTLAKYKFMADKLPARLYIESGDPDAMAGIDQEKMSRASQATWPIIKPYRKATENRQQWCIASVPGRAWAKKVFPDLPEDEAIERMWREILACSRADGDDPIAAWDAHNKDLAARCRYLNDQHFLSLEYKSANGTDFTVGLMEQSRFEGGSETSLLGDTFNPNIPSEEVFTSPRRGVAEGTVVATKPLSYRGELIEDFSITFKNGRVSDVHAARGEDLLRQMVSMDEGAGMLGECALIAYDSPISRCGTLFYNTLIDENASCHLALGRGFPDCIADFSQYTQEDFDAMGLNDSMIHVDFMIGAPDLSITGVTADGRRVPVFKDGNWAF